MRLHGSFIFRLSFPSKFVFFYISRRSDLFVHISSQMHQRTQHTHQYLTVYATHDALGSYTNAPISSLASSRSLEAASSTTKTYLNADSMLRCFWIECEARGWLWEVVVVQVPRGKDGCLEGLAFSISGTLDSLDRCGFFSS